MALYIDPGAGSVALQIAAAAAMTAAFTAKRWWATVSGWLQHRPGHPGLGSTAHTSDSKPETNVSVGGICAGCGQQVGAGEPAVGHRESGGIFHWDCAPEAAKAKAREWK
jgi:hypothetical protein